MAIRVKKTNNNIKRKRKMKKTYIQPDILIVKMATKRHLLDASNPDVKISTNSNDAVEAVDVESRRRGGGYNWDDDEEDY